MTLIHFWSIISIILCVFCFRQMNGNKNAAVSTKSFYIVFGLAFLLRLLLAYTNQGFGVDINCFAYWGNRMCETGPGGFYSDEVFTDYPVGFLYYLFFVGKIVQWFSIPYLSGAHVLLIKLPAILCDILCAALLAGELSEDMGKRNSLFLSVLYLFQPVVILNSAIWGQVDSLLALCVVYMCICLMKQKLSRAYFIFILGVLIKPQMVMFTPVLLVGILDHVFLNQFRLEKLFSNLFSGIIAIGAGILLCVPFGLRTVITQYCETLGEYPYASVNAYNFWAMLGKNWISQEDKFILFSCKTYGYLVIILIVVFCFLISHYYSKHSKQEQYKYPFLASFIIITMFLFSVRMHERYLFSAISLLLLTWPAADTKRLKICFTGFAVLHFYNTAHIMYFYPEGYDSKSLFVIAISFLMVLTGIYFYDLLYCECIGKVRRVKLALYEKAAYRDEVSGFECTMSKEKAYKIQAGAGLTKKDMIMIVLITFLYSCFALYDLGDRVAPENGYVLHSVETGESIDLVFEERPAKVDYFIGPKHHREFTVVVDGKYAQNIVLESVFTWQEAAFVYDEPMDTGDFLADSENVSFHMTLNSGEANLMELCFKDEQGNILRPINASDYEALFDEENLLPERFSFRNSMYFDEIYHGRSAYEMIHGMYCYEYTHPPLGKIFISLGVRLFGMNPFGWRIIGTLFGILMIPLLYLFGKRLIGTTEGASLAAFIFAFDFMHFTQTRIATIDVYITFFVIAMYYCMYRFIVLYQNDGIKNKMFRFLGLCGICMGFGVASKWTGVYAGIGLAVVFFAALWWKYRVAGTKDVHVIRKLFLFCLVFFVAIPCGIYLLSYLPFEDGTNAGLFAKMLANQKNMFDYHSKLVAEHAFSSMWYQWPIMDRPVWYYVSYIDGMTREGISAFGNPLVWWVGIPAVGYMIYRIFKFRDGKAAFLVIGYLAQYLPWMFITRLTFMYHYFPSVPFVVLMIVYSLKCLTDASKKNMFLRMALLYGSLVFLVFLLFYPVLSGQPVDVDFVDEWLRWREGWVLV